MIAGGRFVRVAETERQSLRLKIDGQEVSALEGDTLLTALLTNCSSVRQSEFGDGARAGFCLMGACQDCWVWLADGRRLRACTTYVSAGMDITTGIPSEQQWPNHE